jgi:DNA-directed RNA polymerase subunit L
MDPRISNLKVEDDFLAFTIYDCNMSIANALRRIIISDIPTFVFRTFPYSENKAEILHNTTRFHNEIIKQRLSCIPIHIDDLTFQHKDFVVEVDVTNDTDNIIYVTTKDFKIKNIVTGKYSDESAVRMIFPPCPQTKDYIEFARLQPKLSETIDGERLALRCGFDIGTAAEDGAYNVISTCAYECTPDVEKAEEVWKEKEKAMKKEGISEEEIELEKKNWHLLEGKRYYIPNSYNFIIESVGVFENMEIVVKACNIMIDKCNKFLSDLEHGEVSIVKSESTLNNGFDVTLKNEDYTLGKVIEYYLYQQHFIADKTVTFCGFRKPHPHSKDSLIRIAFRDPIEAVGVSSRFQGAADNAIHAYSEILKQLGGELAKTGLGSQSEPQQQQQQQPTKTSLAKSSSKKKSQSQSEGKKSSSKKDEQSLGEDVGAEEGEGEEAVEE